MQELVRRVHASLAKPWNKKVGRPKACGLYRAVEIACMYIRHNGTQEFLGDLRDISQPTVSRIVTTLVPVIKTVLREFVPDAKQAIAEISALRAPIERVISHFTSWRIFHTDYRRTYRTYRTYRDAYDAARGLFFFSITWGFE